MRTLEERWQAIEECKSYEEVETLINDDFYEEAPEEDWHVEIELDSFFEEKYVVYGPDGAMTLEIEVE